MSYYDSHQMHEIFGRAYKGDVEARTAISRIAVPCAVAPDYASMVMVQDDKPAAASGERRQEALVFRVYDDSTVSSRMPIPKSFPVTSIRQENGVFSFVSADRVVAGTPIQMEHAMYDAMYTPGGASEETIERCFFSIPSEVVDIRPPKTAADNPPIEDIIGTFVFDEQVQCFSAPYKMNSFSFEIQISTNDRNEALGLLPLAKRTVARIDMVDFSARAFAADELLEILNDEWLDEGEAPAKKADFMKRMSIEWIAFYDDGSYEIYYDDGELFLGHCIRVSVDNDGKMEFADLQG